MTGYRTSGQGRARASAASFAETMSQAWRESAACDLYESELFFPPNNQGPWDEPRAICDACPVSVPCLETALANGERFGMFGGLTPVERGRVWRRRASDVASVAASSGAA